MGGVRKTKTKVLYIDHRDYAAMDFKEKYDTKEKRLKIWNKAINEENNTLFIDDLDIRVRAYDFGTVDDEFIYFVSNEFQDYDLSKSEDFIVLKEE